MNGMDVPGLVALAGDECIDRVLQAGWPELEELLRKETQEEQG